MSYFSKSEPEDSEINGLTCPGYYERKLAEVDAKLATQRAGDGLAYRKMLRVRIWIQVCFAALALFGLVMMGGWNALARLTRLS